MRDGTLRREQIVPNLEAEIEHALSPLLRESRLRGRGPGHKETRSVSENFHSNAVTLRQVQKQRLLILSFPLDPSEDGLSAIHFCSPP